MSAPAEAAGVEDRVLELVHELAVRIARQAGEMLDGFFAGPLDIRFKSKQEKDPVTQADEAIEALVRRCVAERFPEHGVLGEEGADRSAGAEFLWVVDPLDGTANFANGLPIFATSIGVLQRGRPVVAALYTTYGPQARPCVIHARHGAGLFVDGRRWQPSPRSLSGRARLSGVPAGFHRGFRFRRLKGMPPGETRSLGSIAVELGLVAVGALQYALFASPKIWDVAGGVLLVQESGGAVFTDAAGGMSRLERFDAPPGRPLREWKQAVIAGEASVLGSVVPKMRVRHSPMEIAERLAGPIWSARRRRVQRIATPPARGFASVCRFIARQVHRSAKQ